MKDSTAQLDMSIQDDELVKIGIEINNRKTPDIYELYFTLSKGTICGDESLALFYILEY